MLSPGMFNSYVHYTAADDVRTIDGTTMLPFFHKAVSFTCAADDQSCIWSTADLDLREYGQEVAMVVDNGGITNFASIVFRDADCNCEVS